MANVYTNYKAVLSTNELTTLYTVPTTTTGIIKSLRVTNIDEENPPNRLEKILCKCETKLLISDRKPSATINDLVCKLKINFIDLSENFVSSYKLDISKLIFDIISSWSFRNTPLSLDYLKIYSLKIYLLKILSTKLSKNDIEDIKMLIILDFLRVSLYTKKGNEIQLLENKLKNFYDNINNPLRW